MQERQTGIYQFADVRQRLRSPEGTATVRSETPPERGTGVETGQSAAGRRQGLPRQPFAEREL